MSERRNPSSPKLPRLVAQTDHATQQRHTHSALKFHRPVERTFVATESRPMKLLTLMRRVSRGLRRTPSSARFAGVALEFAARVRSLQAQPFTPKPECFQNALNLLNLLEVRAIVPRAPTPPPSPTANRQGFRITYPTNDDRRFGGGPATLSAGAVETRRRRH